MREATQVFSQIRVGCSSQSAQIHRRASLSRVVVWRTPARRGQSCARISAVSTWNIHGEYASELLGLLSYFVRKLNE